MCHFGVVCRGYSAFDMYLMIEVIRIFFFVCFCGLSTCLFCFKSFKQLTDIGIIGTFVYFFKYPFLKRFKHGFVRMIQGHVQVGAPSTSLVKKSKPTIEQLNSCIELDVTKHILSLLRVHVV